MNSAPLSMVQFVILNVEDLPFFLLSGEYN